ncbi:MAG: hypothetical protein ACOC21_02505 [Halanaerobiales bacterium]
MSKNAGKTVTLNKIVEEAAKINLNLALISYGRDGEEIDAITRQKKPRIYIPPHTYFVTASKAYRKSDLQAEIIAHTGIKSLMGEVIIYKSNFKGGEVELVGINTAQRLKELKKKIPSGVDLFLVDGALDRRSSAMPALSEGFILATGAVVGNTEELVIKKTIHEIRRLTLPELKSKRLQKVAGDFFAKKEDGILTEDGELHKLSSRTSFGHKREISQFNAEKIKAIIFNGALVDSFVEDLLFKLKLSDCQLIVKDGTRVFLNKRNMNLLQKQNINIKVFHSIKLLAITVNPTSPQGRKLDSNQLVWGLREKLPNVPVYDLLGSEYQTIER